MISPQNPLKGAGEIAPWEERRKEAEAVARHPRIRITDIERKLGTVHTVDTLDAVLARYPDVSFVWLIGADNLIQIPRWKRWRRLFEIVPIAVFPRPSYSLRALSGKAACYFAGARVPQSRARALAAMEPPAWTFLQVRPHSASATSIRAQHPEWFCGGANAVDVANG